MKKIWFETMKMGSHEEALISSDAEGEPTVRRYVTELTVISHAWFDVRSRTFRLDMACELMCTYAHDTLFETWTGMPPSREFAVLDQGDYAHVIRHLMARLDRYCLDASKRYRELRPDVSTTSDAELIAAWEIELDLRRQAAESGGLTPWLENAEWPAHEGAPA